MIKSSIQMWSDAADRYKTIIADIYSAENKLTLQLNVEVALVEVLNQLDMVTDEEVELIRKGAKKVMLSRVKEIEAEIHHDLMAVVKALSEQSGEAAGKVHLGATSNDIQDTVLALQLSRTKELILDKLDQISEILYKLAKEHKELKCIGRTHGQFAVPTTAGFKFSNFLYELQLAKQFLLDVPTNLAKFSGAIGNYASTMRSDIETLLLDQLDLVPTVISTQVTPRVVHASFMNGLAMNASVLERISKEIRNLQRSEIREWFEPFSSKQVGSSAMPHKRNPHKSERVSGLARIIRGNVGVALENVALEHERDITHSSVERIIIPESANLLYYIAKQMESILGKLVVNKDAIKRNLDKASGLSKSEQILRKLVDHVGRQDGHEMLRTHVNDENFKEAVLNDPNIVQYISKKELNAIFDDVNPGLASYKTEQVINLYETEWKFYRIRENNEDRLIM